MAEKMDGKSMDIVESNLARLKEIYPEAFTEGKIDPEKLLVLLGENVDNSNEKYSFSWHGKNDCIRLAQTPSTGTLLPCKEKSVNWDTTQNLYIEGDNLEVLKLLQKSYLGKVKMIYIDPPYNTGNDFVYEDDFSDNIANYKKVTGQASKSNAETQGRYHTNWLNMIMPRLKLARTLLSKNGVIFISIDDNEQNNLRKVCDEVFGEDNFIANVVWKRKRGRDNSARWFSKSHEYLLVYAKNKNEFDVNKLELDEETKLAYKNPDKDPRGDYRMLGIWARGTQGGVKYDFTDKHGQYFSTRLWLCSQENLKKLDDDDKLVIRGDNVYRKMFIYENEGKIPETIWDNTSNAANASDEIKKLFGEIVFDTPKPIPYIMEMLRIATDKESIVLDFFSGSATTADAIMRLNAEDGGARRFILVQLPEAINDNEEAVKAGYRTICDIGEDRIRKAGRNLLQENASLIDIGFRVFALENSNLVKWDNSPTEDVNVVADRIQQSLFYLNEGRTNIDFVYEIMLKFGMPLTAQVKEERVGNVDTYGVVDGARSILVCLDEHARISDVEKMADTTYGTLIFADRCFDDANMLINAEEVLKKKNKQMRLF